MMLVGFIIGVITCVLFTIIPGRNKSEYVNNFDGVVYKYVGDVRTLAGKQNHVLLSTKDNGYIALTESELKSKFHIC